MVLSPEQGHELDGSGAGAGTLTPKRKKQPHSWHCGVLSGRKSSRGSVMGRNERVWLRSDHWLQGKWSPFPGQSGHARPGGGAAERAAEHPEPVVRVHAAERVHPPGPADLRRGGCSASQALAAWSVRGALCLRPSVRVAGTLVTG